MSDTTSDITITFDAAGRVLSEDNGSVSLTYSYNSANQIQSETTQLAGKPARTDGNAYEVQAASPTPCSVAQRLALAASFARWAAALSAARTLDSFA